MELWVEATVVHIQWVCTVRWGRAETNAAYILARTKCNNAISSSRHADYISDTLLQVNVALMCVPLGSFITLFDTLHKFSLLCLVWGSLLVFAGAQSRSLQIHLKYRVPGKATCFHSGDNAASM